MVAQSSNSTDEPVRPRRNELLSSSGEHNQMTITEIKERNKAAGYHFFERSTMRFFNSKIESRVYVGPNGIYFVTSEQFVRSNGIADPRKHTVRQFNPETSDINTVTKFNEIRFRDDALAKARELAGK